MHKANHPTPMSAPKALVQLLSLVFVMTLVSCGGGGGDGGPTSTATPAPDPALTEYTVGGTVSGLAGTGGGLILKYYYETLPINGNGGFAFGSNYYAGAYYNVTVNSQPTAPAQVCTVTNGSGSVNGNVTNVAVTCTNSVSLALTGLSGTVVLQNNGGDNLTLSNNGIYTFSQRVATGSPYNVTVLSTSPAQQCTVANGGGIAGGNVTNIVVHCTNSIGGSIRGLTGSVILQNNGSDNLLLSGDGKFSFATTLETGSPYLVSVFSQPIGQTCLPTDNPIGYAYGNVTDVLVQCANGQWTWVGGSNTTGQSGTYGALGVASLNNMPGARFSSTGVSDVAKGVFWLFGGVATVSSGQYLNDMWRYEIATNTWTWMSGADTGDVSGIYGTKGTASKTNMPGSRNSSVSWLGSDGKIWVFGGYGLSSMSNIRGQMNDLWNYNPATGEWAWVSGSSLNDNLSVKPVYGTLGVEASTNVPGGRESAVSWVDVGGNLWLFGGYGWDSANNVGQLNDLWRFNPTTGKWAWMSGSNVTAQNGSYGTKGLASPSNVPGARISSTAWFDAVNNALWLFGGYGNDAVCTNACNRMNDLWKYQIATGLWSWMSGSDRGGQAGSYGTLGVASSSNVPGARKSASGQLDSHGNLWLFSGGDSNDLWRYNISSGQWTWMSGYRVGGYQASSYGALGVSSTGMPPSRQSYMTWMDSNDNLWLFGGMLYNDLWRYK